MHQKNFDAWNERKKRIHALPPGAGPFCNTREVWWCAVGVNIGVEIDGKHQRFERPILILKRFNRHMFWGIPLTKGHGSGFPRLPVSHRNAQSWALLTQLKLFSTKRLIRRIDMAPSEQFKQIQKAVIRLIISGSPHLE